MATVAATPGRREELLLAAEPQAVADARAWVRARTEGLVAVERVGDLLLAISEVVTNAVRHGGPAAPVRLAMTPKAEFLCVQVTDAGRGLVPTPGAMGSDEHGGFGLFIVERLTRRWGITREDGRTRVWFEFDYRLARA